MVHMEMKEVKDSKWFEVEYVANDYIFSNEYKPQNLDVPVFDSVPVINLAKSTAVEAILMACKDFGFFQVINHGIPEAITTDAMDIHEEFFNIPDKKAIENASNTKGWIYTKNDMIKDGGRLWRENLKHVCHPLEEWIHQWPNQPSRYQEVISTYILEIQKLSARILEMICEGLGLEPGYFKDTSELQLFSANFYPPCPDPNLTLGIPPHKDTSLITILYPGNSGGLQVLKDGDWINVGATPNSFVINIGNQLEIISNGKFRSALHRVVTSMHKTRRSISTFVNPSLDCIVEPAKVLVNESNPPCYQSHRYEDYVLRDSAFGAHTAAIQNALISET